jgi:tRNA dimethylallyltransferase
MDGRIVVLVGPTAVGKSVLALELAQRFPTDIITADSRQVYRYMDIGTAKPGAEERARAPHYMLDLVEPGDTYTAARYRDEGVRVLRRTAASGRLALVAGGTGFYVRALLDDVSIPAVAPDDERRARYQAEAAKSGAATLHARLARVDPVSAERIHPNNVARVIRALEIVETLHGPVPVAQHAPGRAALFLGLTLERKRLIQIADLRVLSQVDAGLVDETRRLLEMGYDPASPALSGFGYREMIDYLAGRSTLSDAIRRYQLATHRYIRRQMTWFRADQRIRWIDGKGDAVGLAAQMVEQWLATDVLEESSG